MREALRKKEILSAELWRNTLTFLSWISDFRIFKGSKVKVGREKANYPGLQVANNCNHNTWLVSYPRTI